VKTPRILRAAPVALSIFAVSLSTFAFADKPPAPREQAQDIDAIVRLVTDALRAYQRPDQLPTTAPQHPALGPDQDRTCPWRVEKAPQPPRPEQPGWGRGPQGKGGEGPGWGGGPQNRERERRGWDGEQPGRGPGGPGWCPGQRDRGPEPPAADRGPQAKGPGEDGEPDPER
jgi:hypothetical protein